MIALTRPASTSSIKDAFAGIVRVASIEGNGAEVFPLETPAAANDKSYISLTNLGGTPAANNESFTGKLSQSELKDCLVGAHFVKVLGQAAHESNRLLPSAYPNSPASNDAYYEPNRVFSVKTPTIVPQP